MSHNFIVHGAAYSTATQRVLVALEEKGAKYELKFVDLFKGEHKKAEFVALQPFGQIPVLIDGDFKLFESRACARYVDDVTGASLVPKDSKQRALVEQWISIEESHYTACNTVVWELLFKKLFGAGETDPKVVEAESKKLHSFYKFLNEHLKGKKFLVGDSFSLADITYMPFTNYLLQIDQFKNVLDAYPNVAAWWKNCTSRPSWVKVMALNKK